MFSSPKVDTPFSPYRKEFDNAIVLSANNHVIMNNSHKHWQEFQQALADAGKLYEERREIWKKLNEKIYNSNRK